MLTAARPASLPEVGELYWVFTLILWSGGGPHDRRPVVVVEVPPQPFGKIAVVTRTTNTAARGVFHPRAPAVGLFKDGVFDRLDRIERVNWTKDNVELIGRLDPATLERVIRERYL